MDGGTSRLAGAPLIEGCRRRLGMIAAIVLTLGCAACNSTSAPGPTLAAASPRGGPTVAFESIDGPPESIYGRLVQNLASEAEARRIAVVSRGAPAHYRIRIYAATIVYPKRSVVQWVWDVYDANQQRACRVSGEETVAGAGRNTWAAADEAVIQKIARVGMDRLASFLSAAPREPAPPGPQQGDGPAVAMAPEQ
jgi:hypothetical protein